MSQIKITKGQEQLDFLTIAEEFARRKSGCTKVSVGSVIVDPMGAIIGIGANKAIPDLCKSEGCLRVKLYGDNDKTHRAPGDCRAIHSEISAICNSASVGFRTKGATIYVSRYPCEGCARAIAAAGITTVVYGRAQEISQETFEIFCSAGILIFHRDDFVADDAVN